MLNRSDVIPGLDVNDAISSHQELSNRLRDLIDGASGRALDAAVISSDSKCAFGKWIHGRAVLRYARLSEFGSLRDAHAQFHVCAGNVLQVQQQGNRAAARALHNGALQKAADAFKGEILGFCTAAARAGRQNDEPALALANRKLDRATAAQTVLWILAAGVGATAALKVFMGVDTPSIADWRAPLADALLLLAVACPALYVLVLRPLLGATVRLAQVEADSLAMEAALGTLPPMLITDSNGMIIKVNQAFTQISGFSADDVVGKTPRLLKSDKQDAAFFAAMWRGIAESGAWHGRLWNKRKDGGEFLADLTVTAIRGETGAPVAYVSAFTDLTEQRGALLARDTAEDSPPSSAQSRSEFLAHIGHELRTPMNAVLGFTNLALLEPLDERLRGYLQQVRESGQILLEKINAILDLSKIEAGKIELDRIAFDLAAVCTSAYRTAILQASGKNVRVESSIDPGIPAMLLGDPVRIAQIVGILLGNAVKFTDAGKVALSVKLHRQSHGFANIGIMVKDTGIGMDPAHLAQLFQPFAKAGASAGARHAGSGLGLTIAKSLLEQMGGTLGVESSPGQGSTLHAVLQLPVADAGAGSPADAKHASAPAPAVWAGIQAGRYAGKRLLVAEDDEASQGLIRLVFERFGFHVDTANDGQEAARKIEAATQAYDLILMDIRMPGMGGLEATRIIRAKHPMEKLPIVALSANAYEKDRQESLNAGMNEHLVKPLELDQLNKLLERLLA